MDIDCFVLEPVTKVAASVFPETGSIDRDPT